MVLLVGFYVFQNLLIELVAIRTICSSVNRARVKRKNTLITHFPVIIRGVFKTLLNI